MGSELTPDGTGTTRINGHCLFEWTQRGVKRTVRLRPEHCASCVGELRLSADAQGFEIEFVNDPSPEEGRGAPGRRRRTSGPPKAA